MRIEAAVAERSPLPLRDAPTVLAPVVRFPPVSPVGAGDAAFGEVTAAALPGGLLGPRLSLLLPFPLVDCRDATDLTGSAAPFAVDAAVVDAEEPADGVGPAAL